MKKMLFAALAAGVMSVSANAYWLSGATIDSIKIEQDGHVRLYMSKGSNTYTYRFNNSDAEKVKSMTAAALTAFAANKVVTVNITSAEIDILYIGQ